MLSHGEECSTYLFCSLDKSLDVYTGTYGVLEYPDTSSVNQKIYLYTDNSETWIPVPQYFWKVVHDVENNEAIAFVGGYPAPQL